MVATPFVPPSCSNLLSRVMVMRAPEDPSGCPSAMAPPQVLTLSVSSPSSRMQASDWEAKASFSSTASTSSMDQPVRSSTFRVAGTGPMPMISGASPTLAPPTTRARAVRPYFSSARSETTKIRSKSVV